MRHQGLQEDFNAVVVGQRERCFESARDLLQRLFELEQLPSKHVSIHRHLLIYNPHLHTAYFAREGPKCSCKYETHVIFSAKVRVH